MDRTEIQALIDRVIGKNGIMRAPSWWVKRLLNKMLDYCESLTPEIEVESSVNDSTNPVQSKAVAKALAAKQDADKLAKVATSGSYGDLKDKPTFATVNGKRIDQGGDLEIQNTVDQTTSTQSTNAVANSAITSLAEFNRARPFKIVRTGLIQDGGISPDFVYIAREGNYTILTYDKRNTAPDVITPTPGTFTSVGTCLIEIDCSVVSHQLSFPNVRAWEGGSAPIFEPDGLYLVKVCNGLGQVVKFK